MAEKWTPGPWTANISYSYATINVGEHTGYQGSLAEVRWWAEDHTGARENPLKNAGIANAHLIAAAPELYEALLTLRDYLSDITAGYLWAGGGDKLTRIQPESVEEDLARIDAALAKARGEQ